MALLGSATRHAPLAKVPTGNRMPLAQSVLIGRSWVGVDSTLRHGASPARSRREGVWRSPLGLANRIGLYSVHFARTDFRRDM